MEKEKEEEKDDKEEKESEERFKIEKLVDKKTKQGEAKYRIRWEGFQPEDDTWNTAEEIRNEGYGALLDKYESEKKKSATKEKKIKPLH